MINIEIYSVCSGLSIILMVLFVLINLPYYQTIYGNKTRKIVLRTIILNCLAIFVGWLPVVYLWPEFSKKFLLPSAGILGALGSVGSRFIYQQIVPDELAKKIAEIIARKTDENSNDKSNE